jgi:hypothetical protein
MGRARVVLLALLAACTEPDYWAFSSGSEGTTGIVVWVSDSPVDDADELFVTIDSVELRGPRGAVLSSARQEIELLSLRNGRRARIAVAQAPRGVCDRLVLRVSAARLSVRGEVRPLAVADGTVEIEGPFTIADGTELLVDFNARMSVLGDVLRPVCTAADLATARFLDGVVLDEIGRPVEGAVVSAQLDGDEICSGRTDAAGGFRLGPLPRDPLTLVATARHRGIATGGGPVLTLPAADTGDLAGLADGSYARLMRDGSLIAVAGIDGGEFAFRQVPAGSYELEVWGPGGLLEVRAVER